MKVNNQLKKIVKTLKGNILVFGVNDDKLLDTILDNENILECNLLNLKGVSDDPSLEGGKLKYINIEKLRKKFKKKKTNTIIACGEEIDHFQYPFIKDSIYLTSDDIYLFYRDEKDLEKVIKRYQRYHTKIEVISCSDGVILKVDVRDISSNKIKDTIYQVRDRISLLIDMITEIIST